MLLVGNTLRIKRTLKDLKLVSPYYSQWYWFDYPETIKYIVRQNKKVIILMSRIKIFSLREKDKNIE